MIRKNYLVICLLFTFFLGKINLYAQCTEQKDPEMAKYMKLTKTQDAQGCSQCGMLAFYFCSAKYCVKIEDKRKVGSMISDLKKIIKQMGEPNCCPEYLTKEPEWGIMAGQPNTSASNTNSSSNNNQNNSSSNTSNNNPVKSGNSNNPKTSSGSSNDQTTEILKTIVTQLETNPDNPLNIDSKFINDLSEVLPEGTLKSTLKSYAPLLGDDENLSYRQVYWDISNAFKSSPSLKNNKNFASTNSKIDLLMNSPEMISERFKTNTENYKLGVFMTDKDFITSISNITGSYEVGQATALGVDFAVSFLKEIEENAKFKSDYKNLARLSKDILHSETDHNLNRALIDASLGIEHHIMLTPLYRYDFKQGTSLLVENGVLKFVNPSKNIKKDLTLVEKRHDLNYYKRGAHGEKIDEPAIFIWPNDSLFYIYTGKNINSDIKCNCLNKSDGFVIDAFTGEIKTTITGFVHTPTLKDTRNLKIKGDTLITSRFTNDIGKFNLYDVGLFKKGESSDHKFYPFYKLDKNKDFIIRNKTEKFRLTNCSPTSKSKNLYVFDKKNRKIVLFWGEDSDYNVDQVTGKPLPKHHSSLLQVISQENWINIDAMTNELTGLTMNSKGDLFFIGKNGAVGKLNSNEYDLNDPNISDKIRKSLTKKNIKPYDFDLEKKFTSEHGRISFSHISIYPSLNLSPNEKHLIYVVNNYIYIIDVNNFDNTKEFQLTFEPNHVFFAKEKEHYTIYLQGENEFRFPITKKYDLTKLTEIDNRKKTSFEINSEKTNSSKVNNPKGGSKTTTNNQSLAEEILKLKELLDSGVITQAEFEAGKKKLLEK